MNFESFRERTGIENHLHDLRRLRCPRFLQADVGRGVGEEVVGAELPRRVRRNLVRRRRRQGRGGGEGGVEQLVEPLDEGVGHLLGLAGADTGRLRH